MKGCKGANNGRWRGGIRKHPFYSTWANMMARCYRNKAPCYKNYGGRGIYVCKEWHDSAVFIKWAEQNGLRNGLEIDRIDNDQKYSPINCSIATRAINNRNTSRSKIWNIKGKKYLSSYAAASHENVSRATIHRWCYGGWGKSHQYYSPPKSDCFAIKLYGGEL